MVIKRTSGAVIISPPAYVMADGLRRLVDYLTYKEVTAKSTTKQIAVDNLAKEIQEGWWSKNRIKKLNTGSMYRGQAI